MNYLVARMLVILLNSLTLKSSAIIRKGLPTLPEIEKTLCDGALQNLYYR